MSARFLKHAVRLPSFKVLISSLLVLAGGTAPLHGGPTSLTLQASSGMLTYGASLVLTAAVTPSTATGRVTFYDGAAVLGTSLLSGGTAVQTVHLFSTGKRSLIARYVGDLGNAPSTAASVTVVVGSTPASGFTSSTINMGLFLFGVAVGDFNGDGKADLVGVGSSNSIKTVLGNGNGTFSSPIPSVVGGGTNIPGAFLADFDGDGKTDIVLVVVDEKVVKVLFGNGDGTFGGLLILPAANGAVAIGDFNLDGFPDIAVAQPSSNTIRILLGNGDRTFQPPVDYQPGAAVPEIQVGDLNGDGRPDLVTMAAPLTGDDRRLIVLLGNGDGTFGAPQTSVVNVGFYSPIDQIALEDLNGDGKLDLVLAGGLNTFATVLSGNGDGTFGIPVLYHAKGADQGSTFGLAIVDVNGDGNQDVAINLRRSSSTVDEIQLYAGNGDGTFQTPPDVSFAPTADNRGFVKAEFDGDGRVDFATVDDTITDTVVRIFHGAGLPVLRISTTPTGALVKGQTGSFTITLSNAGLSATSGTVNIAQSFSSGLTLQNMSGIGWACSGTSCSRSDSLAPASSYPSITINFAVSVNAQDREGGSTSVASTVVDNPSLDELFLIADPSCSYSLGSQSAEFVAGGGTGSVAVLATSGCAWTVLSNAPWLEITSQFPGSGNGTVNYSVASNTGRSPRSGTLMIFGQTFTVSEAVSTFNPGVFRSGFFWLEDVDGDQQFNTPPDRAFAFGGVPGDIPISGDWNGSGTTKVGVYRPSNGLFILDYDGDGQFTAADKAYSLGIGTEAGDIPVVGDWNGDGKSKVGLFRQGFFWILDTNGNGTFEQGVDQTFAFGGVPGDVPVVGDWNGDGRSKLGLFRLGFFWILDYNGNGSIDNVNGAGGDKAFAYGGIAGDVPIVGDWNGDGKSKVGVFRSGFFWVLDANGNYLFDGTAPGQDFAFAFGGISGDKPVVGKW